MGLLLLIGALGLLVLPGATRRLGRRLAPAEWARLCGLALLAGVVVLEVTALLYAAPTVLRAVGVHALAEACERALGPLVPGGPAAGWTAAAAAVALPVLVLRAGAQARRSSRQAWMEPCVGLHSSYGEHELVEIPTERILAFSVPVPRPQIVVSSGMKQVLRADELRAVVEHERAHLELGHHRFLVLASALERGLAFLPLGPSTRATRAAVERWADEAAVRNRPEARGALRSALLAVTAAAVGPGVAGFSTADSIVERVDALAVPARQPSPMVRASLYAPGALMGSALTVLFGASATSAQVLVAVAGHCPL